MNKSAEIMRKVSVTLVAALFTIVSVMAGHNSSKLTFKLADNSLFIFELDGNQLNGPTKRVKFKQLAPGQHKIRVLKQGFSGYGMSVPNQVLYAGYINIAPATRVRAMLDHHRKLVIKTKPRHGNGNYSSGICGTTGYTNSGYTNTNYTYAGYNNAGYSNTVYNTGHGSGSQQTGGYYGYSTYGNTSFNGGSYGTTVAVNAYSTPVATICDDVAIGFSINTLLNSVHNASFDRTRLQIAKQGIRDNSVTSRDVLDLMKLMSFESSRLELAKFAHHYVIDENNYYIVNNGFTFASSVRQLNEHLATY